MCEAFSTIPEFRMKTNIVSRWSSKPLITYLIISFYCITISLCFSYTKWNLLFCRIKSEICHSRMSFYFTVNFRVVSYLRVSYYAVHAFQAISVEIRWLMKSDWHRRLASVCSIGSRCRSSRTSAEETPECCRQ